MLIKESIDFSGMEKALDFIDVQLDKIRLEKKEKTKARLLCEEVMTSLISHSNKDAKYMTVKVRRWLGEVIVEISVPGNSYDFSRSLEFGSEINVDEMDNDVENAIRGMIIRSFASDLKYHNQANTNSVRMTVVRSNKRQLYYTLGALIAAIITGLIMKIICPSGVTEILNSNIFSPIKTMFMNSLKMVVAPVVFFSIISAFSQFGNLSEIGKIGGKIIALYLITTVIASLVGIAIGISIKISPQTLIEGASTASNVVAQNVHISIKDMVVSIIPNNFIAPFFESNMLQLIFLAILCGIATSMLGSRAKSVNNFFCGANDLFLKITTLLIKFMPIAVFCSILSLILTTGINTLLPVIKICALFILGLIVMMLFYLLLLLVFARLNPIPFLRKYSSVMLQVASTASSNAALPLNMSTCEKKLGISPRVYSLSLPLGATMNMDGTCVYLGVIALSLAKLYGIEISLSSLLPIVASIVMLSIGAPGVSGAGLVCLSVLLTQLNVPVEAIGLVMGIDPVLGMLRTMSNCLGDVVVSAIVAKSENLFDERVYMK